MILRVYPICARHVRNKIQNSSYVRRLFSCHSFGGWNLVDTSAGIGLADQYLQYDLP